MNQMQVAVYALNPLVIVEFSGSGHFDSAGICFMMLALYLCSEAQKALWSSAALALSFLVKLFPLLLLPAILRKKKPVSVLVFLLPFCRCLSAVS